MANTNLANSLVTPLPYFSTMKVDHSLVILHEIYLLIKMEHEIETKGVLLYPIPQPEQLQRQK